MDSKDQIGELIEISEKIQGHVSYLSGFYFELQNAVTALEEFGSVFQDLQELFNKIKKLTKILQEEQQRTEDDLK